LTDVGGVEFHRPQLPEAAVSLIDAAGRSSIVTSTDIMEAGHAPFFWIKLTCPRLSAGENMRLIFATLSSDADTPSDHVEVIGTFETAPSEGSLRKKVDGTVTFIR
jgi:hypothetical protein